MVEDKKSKTPVDGVRSVSETRTNKPLVPATGLITPFDAEKAKQPQTKAKVQ